MTFLPIVARELRVASRRGSTYWVRIITALATVAIGAWCFLVMWQQPPKEVAMALFGVLTGFSLLYGMLSGLRFTADCLSEEKRDGTLGLLFLTDLKGYDVVLGKLVATSLNAFYGMLALLPLSAVPLLLGGITLGEFARTSIVALNALFFSLAVGLCASATVRSAKKAMSATLLVLLVVAGLLPALGGYLGMLGKIRNLNPIFFWPSPGFTYFTAFTSHYNTMRVSFWGSLAVVHAMGWLALLTGSLIVPFSWQDRPAGAQVTRWRERWRLWTSGRQAERALYRRRLLEVNPFYWLAARVAFKPVYPWLILGGSAAVWLWGYAKYRADWLNEGVFLTTGILLCLLIKGWFASEATRQLAEDRQNGTLELLLSTPLSVPEILRGQSLALQRQFLGPTIAVLGVMIMLMSGTLHGIVSDFDRAGWLRVWVGMIFMLVADLIALYWVGMWDGLTSQNPNRAASTSISRILILPWVGMALLLAFVSITANDTNGMVFINAWIVLGLATDFFFSRWARRKLLAEFRVAVVRKYDPRPRLIRKIKDWFKASEVPPLLLPK